MNAASWGFVGVVVGAIVGAFASIVTTVIANRSASNLQAQADSLDRAERARVFQRETLLSAQESFATVGRLVGRAHHHDIMACRQGAPWGKTPLGEDINEGLGDANRGLSMLVERVADDSLRGRLKLAHSALTSVVMARSQDQAEACMRDSLGVYEDVMSQLGEVLRAHY